MPHKSTNQEIWKCQVLSCGDYRQIEVCNGPLQIIEPTRMYFFFKELNFFRPRFGIRYTKWEKSGTTQTHRTEPELIFDLIRLNRRRTIKLIRIGVFIFY